MTAKTISPEGLAASIPKLAGGQSRFIVAIAGPPGAGKSTLANFLVDALNKKEPGSAAILPMDGYHYDDAVLRERGLLARKGAPETFDAGGFKHMLLRLKSDLEGEIAVPVFDRAIEISRAGARIIPSTVRYIIAEGNYLLLNEAPWDSLHEAYDLTVMVEVPEAVLRARLEDRWKDLPPQEKAAKLEANDLPNGQRVRDRSIIADRVLKDG